MRPFCRISVAPATLFLLVVIAGCSPSGSIEGTWSLDKEASTDFDQWRRVTMTIRSSDQDIFVRRHFNASRYNRSDSTRYPTDGSTASVAREASAKWLDSVHLGVFLDEGTTEVVSAEWTTPGRAFTTSSSLPLTTSTGIHNVETTTTYALSRNGSRLTVTFNRATREEPVVFVFTRPDAS